MNSDRAMNGFTPNHNNVPETVLVVPLGKANHLTVAILRQESPDGTSIFSILLCFHWLAVAGSLSDQRRKFMSAIKPQRLMEEKVGNFRFSQNAYIDRRKTVETKAR